MYNEKSTEKAVEKAIRVIEQHKCKEIIYEDEYNIVLSALKKQIPMKAIKHTKDINNNRKGRNCNFDYVLCPSCKKRLMLKYKCSYCSNCGQSFKLK